MRFLNPNGAIFDGPKAGIIHSLLVGLKLKTDDPNVNANLIKTTKYSLLNFLPKNLFEQFHKIANIYFLLLVILQFIPEYGVGAIYMSILPLAFILFLTGAKDAFEDYKRYKQNSFVNYQKSNVLMSSDDLISVRNNNLDKLQTFLWKDIATGRLVYIAQDQPIPADCLILNSSDPAGICYVETKNLDGETNLKIYEAVGSNLTQKWFEKQEISIEYEDPNPNLYSFQGNIQNNTESPTKSPLTFKHVLLRGSILRNTDYVIGLVLYTGADTKIMLNTRPTPTKRSKIDKQLNPLVAFNFLLIAVLCIITSIGYATVDQYPLLSIYPADRSKKLYKNYVEASVIYNILFAFGASLILYQNIVPISVYISIEFVKIVSAYYIHEDIDTTLKGHDHISAINGRPEQQSIPDQHAVPKSWTIGDDLGQIDYVFSDKTGTLTQNIMEFKKCSINGVAYGITTDSLTDKLKNKNAKTINATMALLAKEMASRMKDMCGANSAITSTESDTNSPAIQFVDLSIIDHLNNTELPDELVNPDHPMLIKQFFLFLSLCHTVLVDKNGQYKAQSPDEAALVSTARDMGHSFVNVINNVATINVFGNLQQIPVLHTIEFSSLRKRMTTIVDYNNQIYMIVKGADSIIYSRLAPNQEKMKQQTFDHLELFANQGLRTLCISYRTMSTAEYDTFVNEMNAAATSFDNRDDLVDQVANKYEQSLVLLGATAIEDKLQLGVPECILSMANAGIKLWVLTGDKVETAINIGTSCNLINKNMNLIIIQGTTIDEMRKCMLNLKNTLDKDSMHGHSLVIDGHSLSLVFSDPVIKLKFADYGMQCNSVICCRVSPRQKADVVLLIKQRKKILALAIGDGANDVSMIQEANIGVGISGLEGQQAAMSSDFAIAQFRYLTKLLLVHGRWTYNRISGLIVNFFYKNCVWVFCLFYYQFYCGFSTVFLFDYFYLLIYNMMLTLLPVLLLGLFDVDVNKEYSYRYPKLYMDRIFGWRLFLIYILDAAWASASTLFAVMFILANGDTSMTGVGDSVDYFGALVSIPIIITANLSVGLDIRLWNIWVVLGLILSALSLFIVIPIYTSLMYSGSAYGVGALLYQQPSFYLIGFIVVYIAILPRLVVKSWNSLYRPSNADIIREMQIKNIDEMPMITTTPVKDATASSVADTSSPTTPESLVNEIKLESRTIGRQMSMRGARQSLILNASSMKEIHNTGFAFAQESSGVRKYLQHKMFKAPQKRILKIFEQDRSSTTPVIPLSPVLADHGKEAFNKQN
eukprot:NODE_53_length_26956_cov_0.387348.p1 type:complete len:1270 gc:universal NODE_53_length_26956_cov_0.387348:14886-11077(-)